MEDVSTAIQLLRLSHRAFENIKKRRYGRIFGERSPKQWSNVSSWYLLSWLWSFTVAIWSQLTSLVLEMFSWLQVKAACISSVIYGLRKAGKRLNALVDNKKKKSTSSYPRATKYHDFVLFSFYDDSYSSLAEVIDFLQINGCLSVHLLFFHFPPLILSPWIITAQSWSTDSGAVFP